MDKTWLHEVIAPIAHAGIEQKWAVVDSKLLGEGGEVGHLAVIDDEDQACVVQLVDAVPCLNHAIGLLKCLDGKCHIIYGERC